MIQYLLECLLFLSSTVDTALDQPMRELEISLGAHYHNDTKFVHTYRHSLQEGVGLLSLVMVVGALRVFPNNLARAGFFFGPSLRNILYWATVIYAYTTPHTIPEHLYICLRLIDAFIGSPLLHQYLLLEMVVVNYNEEEIVHIFLRQKMAKFLSKLVTQILLPCVVSEWTQMWYVAGISTALYNNCVIMLIVYMFNYHYDRNTRNTREELHQASETSSLSAAFDTAVYSPTPTAEAIDCSRDQHQLATDTPEAMSTIQLTAKNTVLDNNGASSKGFQTCGVFRDLYRLFVKITPSLIVFCAYWAQSGEFFYTYLFLKECGLDQYQLRLCDGLQYLGFALVLFIISYKRNNNHTLTLVSPAIILLGGLLMSVISRAFQIVAFYQESFYIWTVSAILSILCPGAGEVLRKATYKRGADQTTGTPNPNVGLIRVRSHRPARRGEQIFITLETVF